MHSNGLEHFARRFINLYGWHRFSIAKGTAGLHLAYDHPHMQTVRQYVGDAKEVFGVHPRCIWTGAAPT